MIKLALALCLLSPLSALAQDLKHTFQFGEPYVDQRGTADTSDDTKYQRLTLWAPAKPGEVFEATARIESLVGETRAVTYPLSGVCESMAGAVQCHMGNEFVGLVIVLRLDGKETWGEVTTTRGMFGEGAYNLVGLLKSEAVTAR